MNTITVPNEGLIGGHNGQICAVLERGGLVCMPCNGSYRFMVDATNSKAVITLLQCKSRTQKAPSLIFVADTAMLKQVVSGVDNAAKKLMEKCWPGPLTILLPPSDNLPPQVVKELTRVHGKLGVRVPASPVARQVVKLLGRPVLVSSANKQKKSGAQSPAMIKKNFASRIDLFIEAGELTKSVSSTVVDIEDGEVVITREGIFDAAYIKAVLAEEA